MVRYSVNYVRIHELDQTNTLENDWSLQRRDVHKAVNELNRGRKTFRLQQKNRSKNDPLQLII